MRTQLLWIAGILAVAFAVNVFWFGFELTIYGSALGGLVQGGHYYVPGGGASGLTEVNRETWDWLRLHELATLVTFPVGMLAVMVSGFEILIPWSIGGRVRAADTNERLLTLGQSGPLITSASCGGRIGSLRMSRPFLQVSVYPGGLALNSIWSDLRVVLVSEVHDVGWTRWWGRGAMKIDHDGTSCASPVLIFVGRDSPLASAILQVTDRRAT